MNECDSACETLGMKSTDRGNTLAQKTEWIIENLPSMSYGLDRAVNYIFSNGLTTGDNEAQNKRLKDWLFAEKNLSGANNYSVLRETTRMAKAYGEAGLRWYEGDIYAYKQGTFGLLVSETDGIEKVEAAYIRKDGKPVPSEIKDEYWGQWSVFEDIVDYFKRNELILLDRTDFAHIRNDTSKLHGTPTMFMDKQRVNLLLDVYAQLNHDINFDGVGRTFFWENQGYTSDKNNEVSTTTELLNNSPKARQKRTQKAKEEVRELAMDIKNAGPDAVGVLSNALSRDVLQLPRVTKATEFLGWLQDQDKLVAQILGIDPVLLGVGELHGNVSMEKLIDNAMLNDIIPEREKYAIQYSEFISPKIGVDKIYFDKYDMKQVKDENEERAKLSLTVSRLATALNSYDSPDIRAAIDTLTEIITEGTI